SAAGRSVRIGLPQAVSYEDGRRLRLQEYRSKEILAQYGVPLQAGTTATTPEEAATIARTIARPVVVKAQVLVGSRGKAGGVKLAETPEEAARHAAAILGMSIKG